MRSRDKLSRDGPKSENYSLSLNIVGKQLNPFGFSAILRTPKIGPLVRAPEPDLQTCKLGAQR